MKFRTAYDGEVSRVSDLVCEQASMTRQSMLAECDINNIMAKFEKSGLVEHVKQFEGNYGEFAAIDFHEAMTTVVAAEQMFESVPAKIRAEFDNDPGAFLEFVNTPDNEEKMRELGLLPPVRPPERPPEAPTPAPEEAPST